MACSYGPGCSDFSEEANRLKTFQSNWSSNFHVTPEELSQAGLYFIGPKDKVKCAWCRVELGEWNSGESVLCKHTRTSPRCPFVIQIQLSRYSKQIEELNLQLLEKGYRDDMNWQRHVRNSNAVKILKDMGFEYDVILKAVEKITANTSNYEDINTTKLLDEIFEIEDQNQRLSNSSTDSPLVSSQRSKENMRPKSNAEIVQEAIKGVLSVGEKVTMPKVLSTVAIITYHQLFLIPVQEEMAHQLAIVQKENTELKEKLYESTKRTKCKVCLDNDVNSLFQPCGHLVCCDMCSGHVTQCPVCRDNIMKCITIYLS